MNYYQLEVQCIVLGCSKRLVQSLKDSRVAYDVGSVRPTPDCVHGGWVGRPLIIMIVSRVS